MDPKTADPALSVKCPRCGAPLGPTDRFCAVCGATRPNTPKVKGKPRRGLWLVVGSGVCLAAVFAVVAYIYFSAPERHATHPVSRVSTGAPRAAAILPGSAETDIVSTNGGVAISRDQASDWAALPSTNGIAALAVATNPAPLLYAGGDGLWKSDGSGVTKITSNLPAPIRALAVDPRDARRLLAATDNRTILASSDGGQTWGALGDNAPANITGLAFGDPANPTIFASTSGNGIFASVDGRSWSNASGFVNGALPTRNVFAIAFDPLSGDRYVGPSGQSLSGALYAATDIGIFKSIDAGVSWSPMPFHQAVVALAVAPDGSHRLLAVDANGNVYRSTDGGATWG
jgi:photosystem II stability/assembly factor-like uncharacterized protein